MSQLPWIIIPIGIIAIMSVTLLTLGLLIAGLLLLLKHLSATYDFIVKLPNLNKRENIMFLQRK